jgi:hypothetical protein
VRETSLQRQGDKGGQGDTFFGRQNVFRTRVPHLIYICLLVRAMFGQITLTQKHGETPSTCQWALSPVPLVSLRGLAVPRPTQHGLPTCRRAISPLSFCSFMLDVSDSAEG